MDARVPKLRVVPAASPATILAQFLALARTRPGWQTYSSGGHGSAAHTCFAREIPCWCEVVKAGNVKAD